MRVKVTPAPIVTRDPVASIRVNAQHFVDLRLIAAAARSKSLADEIRFFANQANIKHAAL